MVDSEVEIFSVCITLLQIGNPGALPLASPLQSGYTNHSFFESFLELPLIRRKHFIFLGHIEAKDDLQSHVQLDLSVGEDGFAPSAKPLASLLELVKKKLTRIRVGGSFIPSFLHHKLESRHLGPKILKADSYKCKLHLIAGLCVLYKDAYSTIIIVQIWLLNFKRFCLQSY